MAQKLGGLGKGLDALFLDNMSQDATVSQLKISMIEPNKNQPRRDFDEAALLELADSIREHGVIQPLIVRSVESGGYQIVAGERRWRASRIAGLSEVPVVVRELNDTQTLEIAIIENLQREDLNVIELAFGYKSLMDEFGLTQEQVAEKLGKSRPVIANTIRLLALPDKVQQLVRSGKIGQSHAKAILALENTQLMEEIAHKVVNQQMLVKDIEKLARINKQKLNSKSKDEQPMRDLVWGDNYYSEMQIALSTELGRKVVISGAGKRSTISIDFYSNEELADIAARLAKTNW